MTTKEFIEYLSDGTEFNAWYQSMVHQVIDEREYIIELFKKIPAHRATLPTWINDLQEFVNHSWWKFLNLDWHVDILPPKFKRKIKKRLAQTFRHLHGESEVGSPVSDEQLNNALRDSREVFWHVMNDSVVGYDGYENPEAMTKRFQQTLGSEASFLEQFADDVRFRSIPDLNAHTLEPLTAGQKLKLKSNARGVYRELLAERDYLVAEGRKKAASVQHNGEVYRHALTPQQKDRKKNYLLQQNLQGRKGIPTWEEVKEMIDDNTHSDEHGRRVEWAHEESGFDHKIDEVVAQVFGHDHPVASALRQTSIDSLDSLLEIHLQDWTEEEWKTALRKAKVPFLEKYWPKFKPYFLDEFFKEWAAEEVVMDQYKERYETIVHDLKYASDLQTCYRMISLPEKVDPSSLDGLGVYWSMDEEKVGLYVHDEEQAERRPVYWRFSAAIDYKYVDLWETVMHYMNPEYGHNEDEVRWFKHAPILVHDAEEIIGYDRESHGPTLRDAYGYDTGRTVVIEATRRT